MSVLFFTSDITIHKQRGTHVLTHRAREGARAHDDGPRHWIDTNTYPVQAHSTCRTRLMGLAALSISKHAPPQPSPCAQRAPHPPPRAARPPPAPARAQSRGQAWGWRHSAPWSSASLCSSPAGTDDALLRLPERVTVPRDSTGSSSAPKSLCAARHTAGSVASTVILGTGKGKATLGSWV